MLFWNKIELMVMGVGSDVTTAAQNNLPAAPMTRSRVIAVDVEVAPTIVTLGASAIDGAEVGGSVGKIDGR